MKGCGSEMLNSYWYMHNICLCTDVIDISGGKNKGRISCVCIIFVPHRGHMSSAAESVENASIISESAAHEGNRLWIGNIDPKITE